MKYVLDTNAVIYYLKGRGSFPEFGDEDEIAISSISKIELLSGKVEAEELSQLKKFVGEVKVIALTDEIIEEAVELRRQYRLKTSDAIITGTALKVGAVLITADREIIKKIKEWRIIDPLKD